MRLSEVIVNCVSYCRFQLQKRSQLFIRTHNETPSIVAMGFRNSDGSAFKIVGNPTYMVVELTTSNDEAEFANWLERYGQS